VSPGNTLGCVLLIPSFFRAPTGLKPNDASGGEKANTSSPQNANRKKSEKAKKKSHKEDMINKRVEVRGHERQSPMKNLEVKFSLISVGA